MLLEIAAKLLATLLIPPNRERKDIFIKDNLISLLILEYVYSGFLISTSTSQPDPPQSIRCSSPRGFPLRSTGTYVKSEKHICASRQRNVPFDFSTSVCIHPCDLVLAGALICLGAVDLHILTDPRYKHSLSVVALFASHLPPFFIFLALSLCSASHLAFFFLKVLHTLSPCLSSPLSFPSLSLL